jgi:DNA-binding response OmpR family regulator
MTGRQHRILIIEDDADIARLVELHLGDVGWHVDAALDGDRGLELARRGGYDLIVLDLMLPGVDGLEICRRLRAGADYTPILMLTARSSETDRVVGLELGADDYLTKPFSVLELVARIKAIFRRIEALREPELSGGEARVVVGDLEIDAPRRRVTIAGSGVELTAREFDLLLHFARHPGRVFTRSQLLAAVWGYGHEGYEHTVNSHINRLRAKIEPDPAEPSYVLTVWGVGYRMFDPQE